MFVPSCWFPIKIFIRIKIIRIFTIWNSFIDLNHEKWPGDPSKSALPEVNTNGLKVSKTNSMGPIWVLGLKKMLSTKGIPNQSPM